MAKKNYHIVTGASVVVVRGGKRVSLGVGSGEHFTDEELATIKRHAPGALRKPIVEKAPAEDDTNADADEGKTDASTKKATGKKAPKPATPPADEPEDEDGDEGGAAEEDEDI